MSGTEREIGADDEGVSIERRSVLWIPVAASAGVVLGAPVFARGRSEVVDARAAEIARATAVSEGALAPLTREEFAERWRALAAAIHGEASERDESYAMQLAGLVARVPIDALPKLEKPKGKDGVSGGLSWEVVPCVTVEFRLDPGAVLRWHNHPPQVVLTLCAEGEARYRHFEVDGDAPPCTRVDGEEFRVRETRAGVLRARQTTSLTRARDGMHGFVGGARGARLIDFTLGLSEDMETFSYVEVSEVPVDRGRGVYGARWLGKV